MKKLSPHLSIYKFPITAISSITNRVTGIYITGSLVTGMFFSIINEETKNNLYLKYDSLNSYNKKIFHSVFLYPFGYHFMGGLRHLLWDSFPHLLTKSKVASSSKILFISAIIPTLLLENKFSDKIKNS